MSGRTRIDELGNEIEEEWVEGVGWVRPLDRPDYFSSDSSGDYFRTEVCRFCGEQVASPCHTDSASQTCGKRK